MLRFTPILLLLAACNPADGSQPDSREQADSSAQAIGDDTSLDLEEFVRIADGLEQSDNPYLGRAQIPKLRAALKAAEEPVERASILESLARNQLRLGEVEIAVSVIEKTWEIVESLEIDSDSEPGRRKLRRRVMITRAQTYLRQAEVENCITRHNLECCIFPLEGGGVHTNEAPARKALGLYLELAREEPDKLSTRWMCNLLAMALGEHPEALPEELVIPLSAFESDFDIGRFRDVASLTGAATFSLCEGSAVEDFDNDGYLDIIASNFDARGPLVFLRNDGQGAFEDRAESAGLQWQLGGLNLITADYDSDGDADLLALRGAWLLNQGKIRNSLLRNDGNGQFTDVTSSSGIALPAHPTQTAAFGDFNADGHLDLYVGNESFRNEDHEHIGLPAQLFMNQGDATFALSDQATNDRFCKGVAAGDYDGDGDLDLYVSNIGDHGELGINRLYQNDGSANFKDVAPELEVDGPAWSFATWFFDYDNDGQLDLYVGGYKASVDDVAADYLGLPEKAVRPRLYHNEGGSFRDVALEMGLDRPFLPMGANFGDFDNDGWLDIYLATGSPPYETLMPNIALRNDDGKRFQDVTRSGGLGHLQKGHGVTFADIDNDGDQDIFHELGGFLPGDGYANVLFENPGHGARFLYLELEGTKSNRAGFGTRIQVTIETEAGVREIHRAAGSVSSFGGAPRRLEIGLGAATRIRELKLVWPTSGIEQSFTDVPLDARIRVSEESDSFERLELDQIEFGK